MIEERRRRRWVLPVLLLAGAGTAVLVVARSRSRQAGDAGAPPAPLPAAALPVAPLPVAAPAEAPAEEPPGPGSAAPLADGSAPGPEFTIKGNAQSKLFHPPSSPYYARTRAEVWFRTAEDAEAAGFRAYRSRSRS